jgi:hypothetical protein
MPKTLSKKEVSKLRLQGKLKPLPTKEEPKEMARPDPTVTMMKEFKDGIQQMVEINGRAIALMISKIQTPQTEKRQGPRTLDLEVTQRDQQGFIKKVHIKQT